ncbi:type III-B CRISPR module RAMP protein Cmr6 [uncultured Bacteroides sp.]|uniref:type III-B CRISPR module RAMP protein Cmr6 n=1 Tax=uncultured Bacteroides sp. TaxID=162156 RepID=UPI0023D130B4|nr:type III-B CRISPR module RAMP protein Cmr6 [uncultured Bacteroides sp.]MDE5760481.1 type III-B CRISPR module RAMP protein Cmr6 [Bacteroides sp.]
MRENIGWLYNKSYYEKLVANSVTQRNPNEELKGMKADSSVIRQLKNERQKVCEGPSAPYQQFSLSTYYPGLITGIGMLHQTTLSWTITEEKKTITIPELKFGMAFDYATGLPIIPGSSLKGVLRESFPISNQQGFCDSYDEKRKYIAGIIQKLVDIENKYSNRESELHSKYQVKRWEKYKASDSKSQEKLWKEYKKKKGFPAELTKEEYGKICVAERLQELWKNHEDGKISDEDCLKEDELLNSSNAVVDIINENEKIIAETLELSSNLKKKIIRELKDEFQDLLNDSPSTISDDCLQKASLLAKEIFEGQKEDGTLLSSYERDVFFDAFPMLSEELFEIDTITHHPSPFKDPNPISFLKIRPCVSFSFLFKLHDGILSRRQKLLLFYKILCDKGVGAKTNVGYGRFKDDDNSCKLIHQLYPIEEAE